MDQGNQQSQETQSLPLPQTNSYNPWKYRFFFLIILITAITFYYLGKNTSLAPKQTPTIVLNQPTKTPLVRQVTSGITSIPSGLYLKDMGAAPKLDSITDWLNASQVEIGGKSILLVFCTPTLDGSFCSAVVPYLKQWDANYKDKGLTTIWINTPYPVHRYDAQTYRDQSVNFLQKYSLPFPVGQDPNSVLSKRYNIQGWPDLIFIDKHGIRYQAMNVPPAGLAKYDNFEGAITQLLEK